MADMWFQKSEHLMDVLVFDWSDDKNQIVATVWRKIEDTILIYAVSL